ncbi:6-phosphogluconolactonase [Gemella bergeri]|nr:glucosamine-6-phosphate isomerase [Gemella bergeri]
MVKYIVCNSQTAVLNRMYDEFEKCLEDGAVVSLPEQIIGTQFMNRMVDDYNAGKYRYKHITLVGQREFADIDIEEDFGLYRYLRKELITKLDLDSKNIYYPKCLDSKNSEDDIAKYEEILAENIADVAIVFLGAEGTILDYKYMNEENKRVHLLEFSKEDRTQLQKSGIQLRGNKLISIGYENLLSARSLFIVVLGADKREYMVELFENDHDEQETILSLLNEHNNVFIFTDKEASYKSEEEVNRLIKQRQKQLLAKQRREEEKEAKIIEKIQSDGEYNE